MRFDELPRNLRAYLLAHWAFLPVAVAVFVWLPPPADWRWVGVLAALTGVLASWKVELTIFQGKMTSASAVVCLSLLLQGPQAAMLCACLGGLVSTVVRPRRDSWKVERISARPYRMLFNVANCGLACAAGSVAFWLLPVPIPHPEWNLAARMGLFVPVYFLVNTAGVALAIALQQQLPWSLVWKENFLWTAPGFLASACLALLIELLSRWIGVWSWMLLPPVWSVYQSYRLYMDRLNLYRRQAELDDRHIDELNQLNQAIITSLATAIDSKDRYTCAHPCRVQEYAASLAEAAGLRGAELEAVRTGALVRDIGKLGVPDHLLAKAGELTPEEMERVQTHVTLGAEILAPIPVPFPVLDVVLTHHERWDGQGYPNRLRGEEIPIGGRILAIVDAFDALTTHRPYRRGVSPAEALRIIEAGAGTQFDPHLVALFAKVAPWIEGGENATSSVVDRAVSAPAGSPLASISQASAEIAAAANVVRWLAEQENEAQILEVVANRSLALLPGETAVVYLLSPAGDELQARAVSGRHAERIQGMTIFVGEGVAGWVARHRHPRLDLPAAPDLSRRFALDEEVGLESVTAVPLVHGSVVLGVLAIYSAAGRALERHHLRVMAILAEHASAAIHNSRRLELQHEMAYTDPLTGLANSRSLLRHVERLLRDAARAEQAGHVFSVVMLDLNRFKEVNDTLGHLRGDDLLRQVAGLLRNVAGSDDLVGRYAGDEFLAVLPGADATVAGEMAARFRDALAEMPPVSPGLRVGASVGTATYPHDGMEANVLIGTADARMYEDKAVYRAARQSDAPAELPQVRRCGYSVAA